MKNYIMRIMLTFIVAFGWIIIPPSVSAAKSRTNDIEQINPKDIYSVESCQIVGVGREVNICFIGSNIDKRLVMACVSDLVKSSIWDPILGMRIGDSFTIEDSQIIGNRATFTFDKILGNTKIPLDTPPCLISRYTGLKTDYLTSGDQ